MNILPVILPLISAIVLLFSGFTVAVDTIDASQSLSDRETIASSGGTFELGFFSPGSSRGHDIVLRHNNSVVWSVNTAGWAENPVLQLLDYGNLVLRDDKNDSLDTHLWQSLDYPTDTFLPEMKLGCDLKTSLDWQLSSWKSPDDLSPGDFTWGMANSNFPDVVKWKGSDTYFRSGPWNGLRFSSTLQQGSNSIFWYNFVSDGYEIYYMYHVTNKSVLVRSIFDQTNYLWERSTGSKATQSWRLFLTLPYCQCLKGFTPKNPDEWNSTDWLQGCVWNEPLNCSTSDGFMKYSNMKLPDTTHCLVDSILSLEDCRTKCLNNCSCAAYANSDIRGRGSRCAMWFGDLIGMRQYPDDGQFLYVRMPASEIEIAEDISEGQESKHPDDDLELPLFDLHSIVESTNNFSMRNNLGEGGYTFRWREIAGKRLSRSSRQGLREFKNEVLLIANLQHRNLVKLLGCCIQGDEKMLIYEFMPNKSLDAFIFEKSKLLDWHKRFNVLCGVARGLLYLHQIWEARIFGGDEMEGNTNRVVGTYDYMAPEYAIDGLFSAKSDVFSFGILVLKTVFGKRNRGLYHSNQSSRPLLRCVHIGLLCLQEHPEDRPSMSSIVTMLSSDNALAVPQQPGFLVETLDSSIVNEMTFTLLEAR
ncbi:hypothetical protein EUGRSUZ_F01015 [Eucalyptus grandis]|uniref:Uncharacterized protein n=2 Tax=Eucalyptus grandis TaxID=71139 RepID=A0ACC3KCW7_EUCGR|nr:hypothetical protein EUGRSUZ_F01015 [Eucalyptus grandis]